MQVLQHFQSGVLLIKKRNINARKLATVLMPHLQTAIKQVTKKLLKVKGIAVKFTPPLPLSL